MSEGLDGRLFRALVDQASDLAYCADPDGRLRYVNGAWSRSLGISADLARGRSIYEFLSLESRADYRALARRAREDGDARDVALTFSAASGASIRTEGILVAFSEGGTTGSISALVRDLSGRQGIEEVRQEFISRMSHELRTPLTSLLGSLALLRSESISGDPEQWFELFEIAERNGERLLGLIDELLDLREPAGKMRGAEPFAKVRSPGDPFLR
jgi:PAS domain S-box-containing protein